MLTPYRLAQCSTSASETIATVTGLLRAEYGDPDLGNQAEPLDELVFILLSEKTDETKYTLAFDRLRARYADWCEVASASLDELEALIAVAGMGRRRADLLRRLVQSVVSEFGGTDLSRLGTVNAEVADEALRELPGVGHKAARCVMLYCFDVPVLPVDTHTYRLAVRLGLLHRAVSYDRSHHILPQLVPEEFRRPFHVNAVAHGRARCRANAPQCSGCPLRRLCRWPRAVSPVPVSTRPQPIAIDLFAGAGGLSLGFRKAGFQVVQAVECHPYAARTYSHNHPTVDVMEADVSDLDPLDCLERLGLRPGDVTVLVAGPPCQGFSDSNRRTRTLNNERNHLYTEFIRFLDAMQPHWFVFENVAGIQTLAGGAVLDHVMKASAAVGYTSTFAELNAADYGVPQVRRRVFVVGNRCGVEFVFPDPSHGPTGERPHVTVRQAIGDLPTLPNGADLERVAYALHGAALTQYQRQMRNGCPGGSGVGGNLVTRNSAKIIERYRFITPGQNWKAIPPRLMDNYEDATRCHTGVYHRLTWETPSKVIGNFRKNMLVHPSEDRGLSVREAARLQSFPDDYEFLGSIGFQQQHVADAVPPLLAEAIARQIRKVQN